MQSSFVPALGPRVNQANILSMVFTSFKHTHHISGNFRYTSDHILQNPCIILHISDRTPE